MLPHPQDPSPFARRTGPAASQMGMTGIRTLCSGHLSAAPLRPVHPREESSVTAAAGVWDTPWTWALSGAHCSHLSLYRTSAGSINSSQCWGRGETLREERPPWGLCRGRLGGPVGPFSLPSFSNSCPALSSSQNPFPLCPAAPQRMATLHRGLRLWPTPAPPIHHSASFFFPVGIQACTGCSP